MFKLSALNESADEIAQYERCVKHTKEAQEARSFKLYNEALKLQQNGRRDEAVKVYEELLQTSLITESAKTLVNEHDEAIEHPLKDPGLTLKYSAHKNVASICASQGDVNKAMENYLQAVMLDTSDVTLWYKIGILAARLSNLHLSRRALTQGLECNPNHWPCLDSLITICYAILDYENCLEWIAKALRKDPLYKKGICLRRKMISECPHLRKDFEYLFGNCGAGVFEMEISDEDAKDILNEPITLRENNRKLASQPEIPVIPLQLPLQSLTWLSLGKSLISTYEYIEMQEEPISITNRIDLKIFEVNLPRGGNRNTVKISDESAGILSNEMSVAVVSVGKEINSNNYIMGTDSTLGPLTPAAPTSDVNTSILTSVTESTDILINSILLGNSVGTVDGSNAQKKGMKLKKVVEKSVEQGRRSERRSSRMKQRFQSRTAEVERCSSPGLDFRRSLLGLLPKTLQLSQPVELDSDTCSQDSGLYTTADVTSQQSQTTDSQGGGSDANVSFSANMAVETRERCIQHAAKSFDLAVSVETPLNESVETPLNKTVDVSTDLIAENITPGPKEPTDTKLHCMDEPQPKKPKIHTDILSVAVPMEVDNFKEPLKETSSKKLIDSLDLSESQLGSQAEGAVSSIAEATKALEEVSTDSSFQPVNPILQQTSGGSMLNSTAHAVSVPSTSRSKSGDRTTVDKRSNDESDEVLKFINTYDEGNGGILQLLQLYCKWMGRRSHLIWENGLKDVFLKAFSITQPSLKVEHFMETNLNNHDKIMFAFYMLTHLECALDEKCKKHSMEFGYVPSDLEYSDMCYIVEASFHPEVFEEDPMPEYRFRNFILRFHWVRATFFYLSGDRDSAFAELTVCSKLCFEGVGILLHYLECNNKIELSLVRKRLDMLKKFQVLEEVENLQLQERHSDIIKIIAPQLDNESQDQSARSLKTATNTETLEQLQLFHHLLKAAVALKEPSILLNNLCGIIHKATEAVAYLVKRERSKEAKSKHFTKSLDKWNALVNLCCQNLTESLEKNVDNLALLDQDTLIKLTNGLVSLVHLNMQNLPARFSQLSLKKTVSTNFLCPWILLHKVIKYEETKNPKCLLDGEFIPGSVKILLTAHDWLGEKGMCCVDNGVLLRLLLTALLKHVEDTKYNAQNEKSFDAKPVDLSESDRSPSLKEKRDLQSNIEQCFFCLFGYPNKIVRSSALVDHSSQLSSLAWKDAMLLYSYFKPMVLPGFDSYKIKTMLGDVAALLTRVVSHVPGDILSNLKASMSILEAFFHDNDAEKDLIIPPICNDENLVVMKDVYYLLADYYFKNNEMVQAGKHYLHDLCVNPLRFDSWAGLALVKSSIIDERLRLSVAKPSTKGQGVLELSKVALLCFKKAMIVENVSTTLWIEYGSLAYWTHSFHSRQRRIWKDISAEEADLLEKEKVTMLKLSEQCFLSALKCDPEDVNTEEWLIEYMLGKVLEKRRESPQRYLPKYSRSASLLHRKHAKYPKKIQFKWYQNDYAIEALEMYFRLHASMLKLVQHEVNILDGFEEAARPPLTKEDYDLFDDLLEEAEEANFVKRESLPYSQLNEKSSDGQTKKQTKLVVSGSEKPSGLTMGSLLPDSIASSITLPVFADPPTVDETSDDNSDVLMKISPGLDPQAFSTDVGLHRLLSDDMPDLAAIEELRHTKPSGASLMLSDEQRLERALQIIKSCVSALHLCLGRLPQHYKSLYRLADLYWRCSAQRRHVTWSRDLLLGSELPWQQLPHMPAQGLVSERNKTNLFNGVWKIPVDEIDRPGSFGCHLYSCILLLLDVLLELKDHIKLLYLHTMLNRTPDQGRKFLQDSDRIVACKKAFSYSVIALRKKVQSSPYKASVASEHLNATPGENHTSTSQLLDHVIDAGKLSQLKQRIGVINDETTRQAQGTVESLTDLLLAAFQRYTSACPEARASFPNFDYMPSAARVDRILKFCQHQSATLKTGSAGSGPATPTVVKSDFRMASGLKKSPFEAEKRTSRLQEMPGASTAANFQKRESSSGVAKKGFDVPVSKNLDTSLSGGSLSAGLVFKKKESQLAGNPSISLVTKDKDWVPSTEDPMDMTGGKNFQFSPIPNKTSVPDQALAAFNRLYVAAQGAMHTPKNLSQMAGISNAKMKDNAFKASITDREMDDILQSTTIVETIAVMEADEPKEELLDAEKKIPSAATDFKITSEAATPKAEIKTLIEGSKTYTKIIPAKLTPKLSPSPRSAFTLTRSPLRMKRNPQLEKLSLRDKAPLARSASLPESSNASGHKTLHRTGSISDYTKQKLKSSILSRTSASLVRKPSITKREMEQLLLDAESSQSEEEEEVEALFKPLDTAKEDADSYKPIDAPVAVSSFLIEDQLN